MNKTFVALFGLNLNGQMFLMYSNRFDQQVNLVCVYVFCITGEIEVFYDVTDDRKCLLATVPYDLVLEEGLKYKETFDDVRDANDVTKQTLTSKRYHNSDLEEYVVALKK